MLFEFQTHPNTTVYFFVDSMLSFKDFSRKLSISTFVFWVEDLHDSILPGPCTKKMILVCSWRQVIHWYFRSLQVWRIENRFGEWSDVEQDRNDVIIFQKGNMTCFLCDRNKSSSKSANELRMSMSLKVHPAKYPNGS